MKVICVDDERLLMEDTVALCLEIDGIDDAKGFTQPKEALHWLERERVDAALLDIDMPGMSGLELAAEIRARWLDTAIFFPDGILPVRAGCLWRSRLLLSSKAGQKTEVGRGNTLSDHE